MTAFVQDTEEADMHPQAKRYKKYSIKNFNQSLTCTNAEIEQGRGGKKVFPPTKDIGTRVGE